MADALRAYAEKLLTSRKLAVEWCSEAADAAGGNWLRSPSCKNLSRKIIEGLARTFQNNNLEVWTADNKDKPSHFQKEFSLQLNADDNTACSLEAGLQLLLVIRTKCFSLLLDCVRGKESLHKAAGRFDAFFQDLQQTMISSCYQRELSVKQKSLRMANLFILHEKRRYRTIFNRMSEPAFIVDKGKRITDVNRAFEGFVGAKREELIGRGCCSILGSTACTVCGLERALSKEESFSNLEAEITINGSLRTVLFGESARKNTALWWRLFQM
ncbi:MAG: PAS domain S-box protein [Deltaproteobacteria bacterium]